MMRHSKFVALILTHGRPNAVDTYTSLLRHGYTGPILFVVDNEDRKVDEYRAKFGDERVVVFDKKAWAARIDEGDNFAKDRRSIVYARNASFEIARERGYEFFIQLDDDYVDFRHKRNSAGVYIDRRDIRDLDAVFDVMLDYFESVPNLLSLAMAQGGDFVGGRHARAWHMKPKRKCMNSFVCSVNRPFPFFGRINEDVNVYTNLGARGGLFLTTTSVALQQRQTQTTEGGMTELYLDSGTYVKSFYSVMYQPSSVQIGILPGVHPRIHHKVRWRNTVPCILPETFRKPRAAA